MHILHTLRVSAIAENDLYLDLIKACLFVYAVFVS